MTTTLNGKSSLVVLLSIQRRAAFKAGDQLDFKVSGNIVSIVPRLAAKRDDYSPAQRRVIDARPAKAEAYISNQRIYGPFNSPKEMSASIEANIKKRGQHNKKLHPPEEA